MLSPQALKQALTPIFSPGTMPTQNVVAAWLNAYRSYAQSANAGPVFLATPLLVASSGDSNFLLSLDSGLRVMWMGAAWIGVGVTAATSIVPSIVPLITQLFAELVTSTDPGRGLQLITEAFHRYTLSITVTVITAGVGSPVLLT